MSAIIQIGKQVYPDDYSETGDRLFVHQMGDGFAIVSDFHEDSLERPISIATALMRYVVASTGHFASAAIAEGDFADIQGCYPEEARRYSNNRTISLGSGIMTLFPVMGTAFIRAHKLSNTIKPSWPFLIIPENNRDRVPSMLSVKTAPNNVLSINWIESQTRLVYEIQNKADLQNLKPCELRQKIQNYDQLYSEVVRKWKDPLCDYLNIRTIT